MEVKKGDFTSFREMASNCHVFRISTFEVMIIVEGLYAVEIIFSFKSGVIAFSRS
jgi:hypothetical protein